MKKTNTIHVEASIIGTLLCAPEYFATANKTLKPEMFRYYKDMYDWMYDLDVNKMMSWDVQMAASKFGDISDLIVASEPETCSAQIAYLKEQYDTVQDGYVYISAAAMLEVDSPYTVREYILSKVGENNEVEAEKSRGDKMYEAWQAIESGEIGIETCWPVFNDIVGGVKRGQTGFIAGTTGTGKTEKAIKLGLELAKSGKPFAFFTMELLEIDVWQRAYSIESGLTMKELSNKVKDPATGKYKLVLSEEKGKRLSEAIERIANAPFFVIDIREVTNKATFIRQKIRWYIRKYDLFGYCIDYAQLCETGIDKVDNSGNETKVLAKFAKDMMTFNKATKVLGVWCSQLNRGIETRGDRRPRKSDLMGTSSFENAADWILLLFRPGAYEDWAQPVTVDGKIINQYNHNGTMYNHYDCEYIIAKNRPNGGRTGSWWEWQESYEQPKVEPTQEPAKQQDNEVIAQAGRENLEAGELPF